jgi:NAD(P)-dependent dehydrogenase (short-subunit alcohol dehydrogenase family)
MLDTFSLAVSGKTSSAAALLHLVGGLVRITGDPALGCGKTQQLEIPAWVGTMGLMGPITMTASVYSATKAGLHAFSMALRHQLSRLGIKVFEVVPPAVDTELNPEGRAQRGGFKADLSPEELTSAVMKDIEADVLEIGYGMSTGMLKASKGRARQELSADEQPLVDASACRAAWAEENSTRSIMYLEKSMDIDGFSR